MKKHLLSSILIFLSTLILVATGVFAWVILTFSSDPIIVEAGDIEVSAILLRAEDDNHDGTLDLDPIDSLPIYNPITTAITFEQVIPGQTYTFRLTIENTGNVDGYASVDFSNITASVSGMYDLLSVTYINPVSLLASTLNLTSSSVSLFDDLMIEDGQTFDFDFTINIRTNANNTLHNESISIGTIMVTLNQIQGQA